MCQILSLNTSVEDGRTMLNNRQNGKLLLENGCILQKINDIINKNRGLYGKGQNHGYKRSINTRLQA